MLWSKALCFHHRDPACLLSKRGDSAHQRYNNPWFHCLLGDFPACFLGSLYLSQKTPFFSTPWVRPLCILTALGETHLGTCLAFLPSRPQLSVESASAKGSSLVRSRGGQACGIHYSLLHCGGLEDKGEWAVSQEPLPARSPRAFVCGLYRPSV